MSNVYIHTLTSYFMCCEVAVTDGTKLTHSIFIPASMHACRVDSPTREVTKAEMRALESTYGVPVLTTANVRHTETSRYLPGGVAPDPLHVSVSWCIQHDSHILCIHAAMFATRWNYLNECCIFCYAL